MEHESGYIQRLKTVIDERKWTEALNKNAMLSAERMIQFYKDTDREFDKNPPKARQEELIKALYVNLREVLTDQLIKGQLAAKHPEELKEFEARLARMSPYCEKFELKAKDQASKAIKAYIQQEKIVKESTDEQKLEKLHSLYKLTKEAYSEPLVKLHLKENMPETFKKFEESMNIMLKNNLHNELEKKIKQQEVSMQKQLQKQKNWEIEF